MNGSANLLRSMTLLGLLGVVAAFFAAPRERFWANWVLWFVFLLTVALGSLFIVALEHLVGARWSVPLRRVPERIATLLIPAAPLALVGLLALPVLYPGTRTEASHDAILAGKTLWLGAPFFSARVALFLVLWLGSLAFLVRGSLRQDETRDPAFNVAARRFAPLFMAFFALGITAIAFDWISGLEPSWYSDIIGVYLFAGSFLAGLAATTVAVLHLRNRGRLDEVGPSHLYNLGGFIFAFTVFWSYIGFAQYMLMWYGNMPDEVFWYKERIEGGWLAVALLLAVVHFLIPFFALITSDAKSDPSRLRWVAVLMLCAHALDLYWLIFPALKLGPVFSWPEASFALLFAGGGLLWVRGAMARGQDMPVGDPFLREGLEIRL